MSKKGLADRTNIVCLPAGLVTAIVLAAVKYVIMPWELKAKSPIYFDI